MQIKTTHNLFCRKFAADGRKLANVLTPTF